MKPEGIDLILKVKSLLHAQKITKIRPHQNIKIRFSIMRSKKLPKIVEPYYFIIGELLCEVRK